MKTEEFKNMTKVKKILTVAKYIIENNATIEQTSLNFGISTSSIKKYINDDYNLKSIDPNIYQAVKLVQDKLQIDARSKGGKNGKRTSYFTDFEVEEIALVMLERGWTLEQASAHFDNIPKSTLYDILMRMPNEELKHSIQNLFDENNKFKGGRR